MNLLEITGLKVTFAIPGGNIHALDSIDLAIQSGESCAIVGESGCGKSVLGMAVMRLLPPNAIIDGNIRYRGSDLTSLDESTMRKIRGNEIAMTLQNSVMSLNPVMKIGRQVIEPLILHQEISPHIAKKSAIDLLQSLGIQDPGNVMTQYPHELSGGMRERILIAMSLICNPYLLIADEPTAGLDILIRNQTIDLFKRQLFKKTLLLITHDLDCADMLCSRIIVMYAGEIVESGPTQEVLSSPRHPYTLGLLASLPSAGLHPIRGISPSPAQIPQGCRFYDRCLASSDTCSHNHPSLKVINNLRQVRCHCYDRT